MRSAALSTEALLTNLADLLRVHGEEACLDLRGNAYGLGVEAVSRHAYDVGFRFARLSPHEIEDSVLPDGPLEAPRVGNWWNGALGPVVTFQADVISLKRVPAGTPVSYGYRYRTSTETTLALVSAGYADGVPRTASESAHVSLRGVRFPIAGRIAMDQFVVDVGSQTLEIGDLATIWGVSPSLEEWSTWSQRPQGALLARLGERVVKGWV